MIPDRPSFNATRLLGVPTPSADPRAGGPDFRYGEDRRGEPAAPLPSRDGVYVMNHFRLALGRVPA
jgi:hypothetical protein